MNSIKTKGFVIKRSDFGETDRLHTLFTFELGKVRAIAKGVRKPLSKLGGHLEPAMLADYQLHEGRNLYTVTGASIDVAFTTIRSQLTKTSLAYYWLDMLDSLTVENEAQPVVFELLRQALFLLEAASVPEQDRLLTTAFTLKLLAELGYLPELNHCVHCHQSLEPVENLFSFQLGGIIGPECKEIDYNAVKMSVDTIKTMRLLLGSSFATVYRLRPTELTRNQLEQITERYLVYHAGRELRSTGFMADALAA